LPHTKHDRDENTFWPWVVGLVLLALVVWVAAQVSVGTPPPAEPVVAAAPVAAPFDGAALQAWVRDSAEMQERAGGSVSYAVAGLRRVAAALQSLVAHGDPALRERAGRLGAAAARIDTIDAGPARVAAARAAFLEAVQVLDAHTHARNDVALQRMLSDARAATAAITDEVPLEEQRHRVFRFFDHLAGAVIAAEAPPTEG